MENRQIEQQTIIKRTTLRIKTYEKDGSGLVDIIEAQGYIFFPKPGKPVVATILYNPMKGFSKDDPLAQMGELLIEWEESE